MQKDVTCLSYCNRRRILPAIGRIFIFIVSFLLAAALPATKVGAAVPAHSELLAQAAVLMDADTGQILYEKNPDLQLSPASITKIMTALVALEHLDPQSTATVSSAAVDLPADSTTAGLLAGEQLRVEELLYAMMLPSANEAANALAEAAAGSQEAFVVQMNRRAAALGAVNTHFANPHGLDDPAHLTTARDMALITRAAVAVPGFADYMGAPDYTIAPTGLSPARELAHLHGMLRADSPRLHPWVIGGKTGYTGNAGYTLVTVAEHEGRTLICVAMNSTDHYGDTLALLTLGFEEFYPYSISLPGSQLPQLPLMDDGTEIGVAAVRSPGQVRLLLHQSVTPADISAAFSCPAALDLGGGEAPVFTLTLPSTQEGLPEVLLTLPCPVETTLYQPTSTGIFSRALPLGGVTKALLGFGFLIAAAILALRTAAALVRITAKASRRRRSLGRGRAGRARSWSR